jgi:hypothetical protein
MVIYIPCVVCAFVDSFSQCMSGLHILNSLDFDMKVYGLGNEEGTIQFLEYRSGILTLTVSR